MALEVLDAYRTLDIAVDLANDYIEPVTLSCGDNEGRVIRVSLTNGGANVSASGLTARLLYNPRPQNPNSSGGYITMDAESGAETATWTASVPGSSLVPGIARLAVQVSSGDSVVCTRGFDGLVESGIINEGASETTSALSEFWTAVQDLTDIDKMADEALEKVDKALEEAEEKIDKSLANAQAELDSAIDEAKTSVETMITQSEIKIDEAIAKADQLIDDIEGNIEEAAQTAVDEALAKYTAITWEIDPDDQGLNCIYNYEEA